MNKKMRREEKRLSEEATWNILKNGEYGVLSVRQEEGAYGIPLSYVVCEDTIYFHCAEKGHKIDCIANCNQVSFLVVKEAVTLEAEMSVKYQSVIVEGLANPIEKEEKMDALKALIQKYSPSMVGKETFCMKNMARGTMVYGIKIQEISGKKNEK